MNIDKSSFQQVNDRGCHMKKTVLCLVVVLLCSNATAQRPPLEHLVKDEHGRIGIGMENPFLSTEERILGKVPMDFQTSTNVIQSSGLMYGGAPWSGLNYQIGNGLIPTGDINGDGKADLLQRLVNIPDISTPDLEDIFPVLHLVFLGDLSGPSQTFTDVFNINPVGDIDGDGFGDAIVQVLPGVNDFLFYFGSATGYVPSGFGFQLNSGLINWATGDFDNDGTQDVVLLSGSNLHIIYGLSNRAELAVLPVSNPIGYYDFRVFRRHDQGRDYIADARFNVSNQWELVIMKVESGILTPVHTITGWGGTSGISRWVFSDMNGDGEDDAVILFGNGVFAWAPANTSPTGNLFGSVARITTELNPIGAFHPDLTGDGSSDLVLLYNSELHVANGATILANGFRIADLIKLQDAGRSFNSFFTPLNRTGARTSYNSLGDVTGDGKEDIIAIESIANPSQFRAVAISSIANSGVDLNAPVRESRQEVHVGANAGDWDSDGIDDYGYAINDFTAAGSRYIIKLSSGVELQFDFAPNLNFFGAPSFGDINGDGKTDMIVRVRRLIDGALREYIDIYSAASSNKTEKVASLDVAASIPNAVNPILNGFHNVGDVTGDGRDNFIGMPSGGLNNPGKNYMLSLIASTYQFNEIAETFGNSAVNIGDIDGDGVDDFAAEDANTNTVKLFAGQKELDPGYVFFPIYTIQRSSIFQSDYAPGVFSFFGSPLASGDFDGNGYKDLVVGTFRSRTNTSDSEGDYILWLFKGYKWGLNVSEPEMAFKLSANDLDPLRTFAPLNAQFINILGLIQTLPDINGDGSDELLVTSYLGSNALILLGGLNLGLDIEDFGVSFGDERILLQAPNRRTQLGHPSNFLSYRDYVAFGDFDNDGIPELFLPQPLDLNFKSTPVYKYVLDIEKRVIPEILEITDIEDVEDDQGGWVRVHVGGVVFDLWEEEFGAGAPSWSVWRKNAASQWVHVTTIPYTMDKNTARYAEVAIPRTLPHGATPDDGNSFVFKATLNLNYTDLDDLLIESAEVRGWALDNIAPAKIQSVIASVTESQVLLEWTPSFANDLRHYAVHAMVDGAIDRERPIAVTPEISITLPKRDLAQYGENVQLVVVAMDIHNNASAPSTGVTVPTSIDDDQSPTEFALSQNFPNPFNPSTVIGYQLSVSGRARLTVYDVLGREIANLVDGEMPAGSHTVTFDASKLTSGIYMYRLQAGGQILTRKMMLVK
jgi:hypothetical protein